MAELRSTLIEFFNQSFLRESSADLLRNVPGLPPILQTIHLLGAAILLGSVVMFCLRLLSVAARNQDPLEMRRRLYPWFIAALPVMLFSALPFFLARPQRYLTNPVFDIKMAVLTITLGLSFWLWQRSRTVSADTISVSLRLHALLVTAGWILTVLAGRWIAYADYIFWTG
ncbi:MAG TPA: DUF6644 family protein [Pseudohongiella sp.]|nr:DUF6644 family protein [Pseudohongiella sp.]